MEQCPFDHIDSHESEEKNMKLNEMLGIKYPIIQGGMANIATGEFAAAVGYHRA